MIGSIRIFSSSQELTFNSDRSNFSQNEFTDKIIDYLEKINKDIQKYGALNKQLLMDFNILDKTIITESEAKDEAYLRTLINKNFSFTNDVKISRVDNRIVYSFAGREASADIQSLSKSADTTDKSSPTSGADQRGSGSTESGNDTAKGSTPSTSNNLTTARIILNNKTQKMLVPSPQINLLDEIKEAYDSKNQKIEFDKIIVTDGGIELPGAILSSVDTPCKKDIYYSYKDPFTGPITVLTKIDFIKPYSKIRSSPQDEQLIVIPGRKDYDISFNPHLDNLIFQINSLNKDNYNELLACSLRAVFELSIDFVKKSTKYDYIQWSGLKENFENIIKHINNKRYLTEIDNSSMIGYNSLKDVLESFDIEKDIPILNLAAHKSTLLISEDAIIRLGKFAGVFLVIVNEMVNNPKIN
jgi:hypothetical protein